MGKCDGFGKVSFLASLNLIYTAQRPRAPAAASAFAPKDVTPDGQLLTRLVGHGWPGEVHGVERDHRGLEETGATLVFLFNDREATQRQKGKFFLQLGSFTRLPQIQQLLAWKTLFFRNALGFVLCLKTKQNRRNSLEQYNLCSGQLKCGRNKQTQSSFSVPKTKLWGLTELIPTCLHSLVEMNLAHGLFEPYRFRIK